MMVHMICDWSRPCTFSYETSSRLGFFRENITKRNFQFYETYKVMAPLYVLWNNGVCGQLPPLLFVPYTRTRVLNVLIKV